MTHIILRPTEVVYAAYSHGEIEQKETHTDARVKLQTSKEDAIMLSALLRVVPTRLGSRQYA